MTKVCHIISGHDRHDPRVFMKECVSLANNGYDVTLLCSDGKADETANGVRIHSIPYIPVSRMDRFIKAPKWFYKEALALNADIYHIHEPFLLPVGKKLKKAGKKVIFDSHEDTVHDIAEKSYIPSFCRKAVSNAYARKEKATVSKFDAVISVTPFVVDRLKKENPNAYMITNYPILKDTVLTETLKRKPTVCYVGMTSPKFNVDTLLKAMNEVEADCILALLGLSTEYEEYLKQQKSAERTVILKDIPYAEVLSEVYSKSTVAVALIDYSPNLGGHKGSLGVTKIFEYMMMGLPMVCTDFELWKEIIEDAKCGICVDPQNVAQIREALNYLVTHESEAEEMGKNGRKLAEEKYNWKTQEKILLDLYSSLTK